WSSFPTFGVVGFVLPTVPLIPAASKPAFCLKPKSIGPCKGRKIRYFYNAKTRQCQRFFYGGCKGNLNNFYTMALCMNTCGHLGTLTQPHSRAGLQDS
uniref:BPTI/Kunitz inhibitor domain-containing protein n=1 Tax=Bos indicus x Bos taurus TaxID=30522 RepID=A0A4W2G2K6_BOBOX